MGPWGLPWSTTAYFIFAVIGCPLITEIVLHSKWWKKQSDFYWSFNEKKADEKEEK